MCGDYTRIALLVVTRRDPDAPRRCEANQHDIDFSRVVFEIRLKPNAHAAKSIRQGVLGECDVRLLCVFRSPGGLEARARIYQNNTTQRAATQLVARRDPITMAPLRARAGRAAAGARSSRRGSSGEARADTRRRAGCRPDSACAARGSRGTAVAKCDLRFAMPHSTFFKGIY